MIIKQYANSGVDGASGYEFQKHCALYIFLEQYEEIKDKKYFICLEHYEDFLFCYLTRDELIEKIETYQAKKSSKKWTMNNSTFKDIVKKILQVGNDLKNDQTLKTINYTHNLHFSSNYEISLTKKIQKKTIENIINERNEIVKYNDLYKEIQDELLDLVDVNTKNEINNLSFKYIDLNKTHQMQERVLVGMFNNIFGEKVRNHKASVLTLLSLFRDVENTLNQKNIISLMDKSKRVDSEQINRALNIITTKQKAFEDWKEKKNIYAPLLKISTMERNNFELHFENAFDYLKDLKQTEHQKIFNFVRKIDLSNCYTDEDSLKLIIDDFKLTNSTQFDDLTVKATILASYIQIREGIE